MNSIIVVKTEAQDKNSLKTIPRFKSKSPIIPSKTSNQKTILGVLSDIQ
ncbi:MAG: hypothetical protein ACJA1H_002076 [Glaciecola sp.]|jgi:hypothetical protein